MCCYIYDTYFPSHSFRCLFNNGSSQTGEPFRDVYSSNIGIHFFLSVVVVVSSALDLNSKTARDVLDTVLPHGSVKLHVKTNVRSFHLLLGEGSDLLDGSLGTLLESDSMKPLVQINGVFTSNSLS